MRNDRIQEGYGGKRDTKKNLYKLIGCYESTTKRDTNDI